MSVLQENINESITLETFEENCKEVNIVSTLFTCLVSINSEIWDLDCLRLAIKNKRNIVKTAINNILIDKELMQQWKDELGITNNDGRMAKINLDFKVQNDKIDKLEVELKERQHLLNVNRDLFSLYKQVYNHQYSNPFKRC